MEFLILFCDIGLQGLVKNYRDVRSQGILVEKRSTVGAYRDTPLQKCHSACYRCDEESPYLARQTKKDLDSSVAPPKAGLPQNDTIVGRTDFLVCRGQVKNLSFFNRLAEPVWLCGGINPPLRVRQARWGRGLTPAPTRNPPLREKETIWAR